MGGPIPGRSAGSARDGSTGCIQQTQTTAGLTLPPMDRTGRPQRLRHPVSIRRAQRWPLIAVLGLLLVGGSILLANQRHSGDPLKVRRELRKF